MKLRKNFPLVNKTSFCPHAKIPASAQFPFSRKKKIFFSEAKRISRYLLYKYTTHVTVTCVTVILQLRHIRRGYVQFVFSHSYEYCTICLHSKILCSLLFGFFPPLVQSTAYSIAGKISFLGFQIFCIEKMEYLTKKIVLYFRIVQTSALIVQFFFRQIFRTQNKHEILTRFQ